MEEMNSATNENVENELNLALEQALLRCKELEDAHTRAIADYRNLERRTAVSYTHLTLPTILLV